MRPARQSCLFHLVLLTLMVLSAIGGCGFDLCYVLDVADKEGRLLNAAVPIEQALDDPELSDEQKQKLDYLLRARDYGEQVLGLSVGDSYRTFVNLHGQPLAWNLSASRKDSFTAYTWSFPLISAIPYLGYFDLDKAIAERDRLVSLGYDTLIYEVDAYSTLGLLPDPVTSAILKRDVPSLVDTVLHELLHNTIYTDGDTTFNESLATFVGRTGAIQFFRDVDGNTAMIEEAQQQYEDDDRFNGFLGELTDELQALYASDASSDEKITAREPIFQAARERFSAEVLPLMYDQAGYQSYAEFKFNNAFLLVNVRYNTDQDVFQQVYECVGEDLAAALPIFAAAAQSENPQQYLRDWTP